MVHTSKHIPEAAPNFRRRSSGLLLHITSLPGRHGSGDLSEAAFQFVDFLAAAGQSWPDVPPPACKRGRR